MAIIYVARSASLADWASDVGLSKHIYKIGITDDSGAVVPSSWCGQTDWVIVKVVPTELDDETILIERLARREKLIAPTQYPRLRGTAGVFKISPQHVENHILVSQALEGAMGSDLARRAARLKPLDFAVYMLQMAQRDVSPLMPSDTD